MTLEVGGGTQAWYTMLIRERKLPDDLGFQWVILVASINNPVGHSNFIHTVGFVRLCSEPVIDECQ